MMSGRKIEKTMSQPRCRIHVRGMSPLRLVREGMPTSGGMRNGHWRSTLYSRDALNRPVLRNEDVFAYNDSCGLTDAKISGQYESLFCDNIGNSILAAYGTATNSYASNSRNQYSQISESGASVAVAYDIDGNMTQYGDWTYAYDSGNRLVSVSSNNAIVASFAYDTHGRRVKKVAADGTHRYFYDGWLLVYEHIIRPDNTTNEIDYVWGKDISGSRDGAAGIGGLLYLKRDGAIYVPFYDAYSNILGYCDAQGNVVARYTYDAFGNTISQSGSLADTFSFRFSTKYFDLESGLYYYGYRYYHLTLMRWLTEDRIGVDGGVNLYAMCENSPLYSIDFLGEARMLTGSLLVYKGNKRVVLGGYNYARNIIRLVDKLNAMKTNGRRVYDAKICDLVTTPIQALKSEIRENKDNVFIVAHGGLIVNNKVFRGQSYEWNDRDTVVERIFPTGRLPGIDIDSLGANMSNVFGCFLSEAVRKVPSRFLFTTYYTSSIDDYGRMFKAMYDRLNRYTIIRQSKKCPIRIRIFEGETANEADADFARTENVLSRHPPRNEDRYKP